MDKSSNEQRFIDIESKILQQEVDLEALHQAVYKQQELIDLLETKISGLLKRFRDATDEGTEMGPSNEKPPHY